MSNVDSASHLSCKQYVPYSRDQDNVFSSGWASGTQKEVLTAPKSLYINDSQNGAKTAVKWALEMIPYFYTCPIFHSVDNICIFMLADSKSESYATQST